MTKPATATELREGAEQIAAAADLPATNVIEALRRVARDLPAIGRDQQASAQQGGYAYRGIEQITKHTQGLFARHCVVFVPRVTAWEIRDITVNGKPWTDTVLTCEYDVYGPGGREDRITVGPILAIGRDNSDKGANKCMTQAFKYALLQALCISDAKDDADGTSHEADAPVETEPQHPDAVTLLVELADLAEVGDRLRTQLMERAGAVSAAAALQDEGWRNWLRQAIEHHRKTEERTLPLDEDAS